MDVATSDLTGHTAERVLQLLPLLHRWAETQALQRDPENDLSLRQLSALAVIRDKPGTLGEVARELMVTPAVVTAMIDRLERRGYVRRVIRPGDRRRIYVELTDEGLHASRALERQLVDAFAPCLAQLPTQEVEALDRGLMHLELALGAVAHDGRVLPGN